MTTFRAELKNATIEILGPKVVLVTTRASGRPSNPHECRTRHRPRQGQKLLDLYNELVHEWTDENGE
jgi:hypothetical protein